MQDINNRRLSFHPNYLCVIDEDRNKEIVRSDYIYGLIGAHKVLWNNFNYLLSTQSEVPISKSILIYLSSHFSDFSEVIMFFSHKVKQSIENTINGSYSDEDLSYLLKLTQLYYPTELISQMKLVLEWRKSGLQDFLSKEKSKIEEILKIESMLLVEAMSQDEYFFLSSKDPVLMPLKINFPLFNESRQNVLSRKIRSRLPDPIVGTYNPDDELVQSQIGSPWTYDSIQGVSLPLTSTIELIEVYAAWFIDNEDAVSKFNRHLSALNSYSLSFKGNRAITSLLSYTVTNQNIGEWIVFAEIANKNGISSFEVIPFSLLTKRIYTTQTSDPISKYRTFYMNAKKELERYMESIDDTDDSIPVSYFATSFCPEERNIILVENSENKRISIIDPLNFVPNNLDNSKDTLARIKKSKWHPIKFETMNKVMNHRAMLFSKSIEFFPGVPKQLNEIPF